jgi:CrcB protein
MTRRRLDILLAIALGGAIGGVARYSVSLALPTRPSHFPWDTFLINVSGSFVLGLLVILLAERFPPSRYARPFIGTGIIGAYTTFSTFGIETDLLIRDGHVGIAAAYALGTLAGGLTAAWIGVVVGRWLSGLGGQALRPDPPVPS